MLKIRNGHVLGNHYSANYKRHNNGTAYYRKTRYYPRVLYMEKMLDPSSGSASTTVTHSVVTNSEFPFPKQYK